MMKDFVNAKNIPVLLVDDRPENLTALNGLLEDMGLHIFTADSGNEALRLTLRADFALVLMDVQMPGMNGFEAAELMRSNPKTKHLPIIFVTAGMTDLDYQFKGYDAGAVDYLIKPVEPVILRSKVKIFCELYRQRYELELHRRNLELLVERRTAQLKHATVQLEERVEERTAELQQALKELDSFSYSVSHDLRAPLRHLNSYANILLEDCMAECSGQAKEYLQRLVSVTAKMDSLIEGLLNLSRMSRAPLKLKKLNLSDMAAEMLNDLLEQHPKRTLTVTIKPGMVAKADPVLIRAVLDNLLSNAWKYTAKAAAAIIEVGSSSREGEVQFFVRDNGAGFDMTHTDKLFGAFQRLHSDGDYPGIGIGLATAQRIIHRHGGKIWAKAEPGKGATFYFTLPD